MVVAIAFGSVVAVRAAANLITQKVINESPKTVSESPKIVNASPKTVKESPSTGNAVSSVSQNNASSTQIFVYRVGLVVSYSPGQSIVIQGRDLQLYKFTLDPSLEILP